MFSPPPGFCFDSLYKDVIMDDSNLEDYNFAKKVCILHMKVVLDFACAYSVNVNR